MAAMSSLKELPAGFRLNTKDKDLIGHFLVRKLQNVSQECCVIPELNIYKLEPWDLIAQFDKLSAINSNGLECFFFCPPHKSPNGKHNRRMTEEGKGYWHETGQGRRPQDTDRPKWAKRIFCYYVGKQKDAVKTEWVMHEFRIMEDKLDQSFVLCRITRKPEKNRKAGSSAKSQKRNEVPQETSTEASVHVNGEGSPVPSPTSVLSPADYRS